MIYELKLGHNATEATRNICCGKSEGTMDHSTVTKWFKKFYPGCKNFNDQLITGRGNSRFLAVLQATEVYLESSTGNN